MYCDLTKEELEEAIKLWETNKPMKPVKEELGGDYYYRCGLLRCDNVIKQEYVACPYCGTLIQWED